MLLPCEKYKACAEGHFDQEKVTVGIQADKALKLRAGQEQTDNDNDLMQVQGAL